MLNDKNSNERLSLELSKDNLEAYVVYNIPPEELDTQNRNSLISETVKMLKEAGITFGINKELFLEKIQTGKKYTIARGIPPVDGKDSIIKMYKLEDTKPDIHENGKVDFYELKLINRVKAGDWLGERQEATKGIPGKSVKNEDIVATDGKNFPLEYDRNTVIEVYEEDKTVLYAKINGAVSYSDGKILVSNHLEIAGDVDFRTGNIKFDGYVSIKGTVFDGFYVEATKDIEVNSQFGLGNIKGIVSTEGSIYIKGGISSKGGASIKAAKSIYTKFVDNAHIYCGGAIHIGSYCINSIIQARELIMDSPNGQIIGGNITAEIKVTAPVIGSEIEKKTCIEVTGFNREALKEQLDDIFHQISILKGEQQNLKQILASYNSSKQLDISRKKDYNASYDRFLQIRDGLKNLEEKRKDIAGYLKTRGDGEICATKKVYPNCVLTIKKNIVEISSVSPAVSYYVQDGVLKSL